MNYKYDYEQYKKDIHSLFLSITKSHTNYDYIVGIVRGGCIPGVHLSNILNIPFVPLTWSHTRNEKDRNHKILNDCSKSCLIVDDILDNGSTLYEVTNQYEKADTATLIFNAGNKFNIQPTYFSWLINRETMPDWFDFWWEKV